MVAGNKKFIYISLTLMLLFLFLIFFTFMGGGESKKLTDKKSLPSIGKEDMDTYVDTVQGLNAKVVDVVSSQNETVEALAKINERLDLLGLNVKDLDITDKNNLRALEEQVDNLVGNKTPNNSDPNNTNVDYPVFGEVEKPVSNDGWIMPLSNQKSASYNPSQPTNNSTKTSGTGLNSVFDAINTVDNVFTGAINSEPVQATKETVKEAISDSKIVETSSLPQKKQKVFTIPKNATIFNAYLATALVGRVPTGNSLNQPYRFKIISGVGGVSSNSFQLPSEVATMTFTGVASGDWGLSCARGKIDSVTFTFNDGEIVTQNGSGGNGIGWISNEYGDPCITGEKVSNSSSILTKRILAGAFTTSADAYSRAQVDTQVVGQGVVIGVEDAGKYATYGAISGGAKELEKHLDKRLSQIFDAIYVPNGEPVSIHIVDAIKIDRNTKNRKVRYENENENYTNLD